MKKCFLSLVFLAVISSFVNAAGMLTFDIENWLQAIEDVYATYDLVNNSITQIENQYRQIQRAIDSAKNIDWENIQFDGDFDIRNDIRSATKRVNQLLNEANEIKESLTTPTINLGANSYSIADLCGVNGNGKNITAAMKDVKNFMAANLALVVDDLEKKMTEEEKMAVWNMYGISPRNYLFVQQSARQLADKASSALGKVQNQAKQMRIDYLNGDNAIIDAALQSIDAEGNMTQGAANEGILRMLGRLSEWLYRLGDDINEATALNSIKMINEEAEKQAEADDKRKMLENNDAYNRTMNYYWRYYEDN
ncbi:MAG: hypothetical protein MJ179_00985 [Treponema sp.]|nr:hypothetical protein [Treponema sp.]